MKKINLLFLTAAMAFSVGGGFVSCKDYEDDLRAELQATKTLLDALKESVTVGDATLKDMILSLEDKLSAFEKELEELKNNTGGAGGDCNCNVDQILADLEAIKESINDLKNDLQEKIDQANQAIKDEHATNEQQAVAIANLQIAITNCQTTINGFKDALDNLKGRVEKLENWQEGIDAWKENIDDWQEGINSWTENINEWQTNINEWQTNINEWQITINKWKEEFSVLPSQVEEALKTAQEAKAAAELNAKAIEALKEAIKGLENKDQDLEDALDQLAKNYQDAIDDINERLDDLEELIKGITIPTGGVSVTEFNAYKTYVDNKFTEIENKFITINSNITAIKGRLDTLEADYKTLRGDVDNIQDYISQLITGVLIQGTSNPIYGSFALPANVNSNMLATYYGNITSAVEFPTGRSRYYADPASLILSPKDLQMMGVSTGKISAGRIVNEAEDNAGTVYMTINPTNIDFTGKKLELVNSLDEAAGVALSPLTKSNKKLTFGWSRAANNGFYEAKARIEANDVEKVKARIDLEELQDALKDVLTPGNGVNISNVVTTIGQNFSNVLDANALKASWITKDEEGNKTEMAVYSQYALAATAIKPLSYNFLQDLDVQNIPGFGRVENLINRIFDKINIPTFDLNKYRFEKIKKFQINSTGKVIATVEISFTIAEGEAFPGQTIEIHDKDGNVIDIITINPNEEVNKTITKDVEVDVTPLLNDIEVDINDFVDDMNEEFSRFNELLDELKKVNDITNSVDNVEKELINYLDRLNNKLSGWINSANKVLQPLMLVRTTDGFARMSEVKKSPTMVNATDITLYPTSFTAEILAPAYKKLVGVTNVFIGSNWEDNAQSDNMNCKGELDRVNAQGLAKVINGSRTGVSVSLKKGYVYEIAYTAVDYHGYVVARKYYVSVK